MTNGREPLINAVTDDKPKRHCQVVDHPPQPMT
jgi:hypothetical protein